MLHNQFKLLFAAAVVAAMSSCSLFETDSSSSVGQVQNPIPVSDPVAHFHNAVLSGLLSSSTKAGEDIDTRTPEHISLAVDIALEEAQRLGYNESANSLLPLVAEGASSFFSEYDKLGFDVGIKYCGMLPYPESVNNELAECFKLDLSDNGHRFEDCLSRLAAAETKSEAFASQYSYAKLLDFYVSDKAIWLRTKDSNESRHFVATAVDVVVGAALSGLSGFIGALAAGTIGALASETVSRAKVKTPDETNCD